MNNADTTLPMANPPISSSSGNRPQETLLQRGAFDPPVTPGTLGYLDRFEILRLLGEGGMGQVYLAREPLTDTQVAVKIMRPELVADPQSVHRFLTEARHMYRLSHPRILRVLEVSDRRQSPYYVMPYVEGGSLLGLYGPGRPLLAERSLSVARQIAEALAHAHAHGIIHRDLKPGNVLLDKEGNAYLTDFGLVRTVFNDSMVDASSSHLEGTAPYMSPAVARGEAEDTRCDIYAFGALLYELLAGQPPYTGRTPQIILDQVLKGPPTAIRTVNPKANPALVRIAEGCLARELRDRYATMVDVVDDLTRASTGETPFGPHKRPIGPKVKRVYAATCVAVILIGVFAYNGKWRLTPVDRVDRQKPHTDERTDDRADVAHTNSVRNGKVSTAVTGGDIAKHTRESALPYSYRQANGNVIIIKYLGSGGKVVVPPTIHDLPVTTIGRNAFRKCETITSVDLPDSVQEIQDEAFRECHGISTLRLPKSLNYFYPNAFADCACLTSLTVDAANTVFKSSYDGVIFNKAGTTLVRYPSGKAGEYVVPETVTSIGVEAFSVCRKLTSVVLADNVTDIGVWAFGVCTELSNIRFSKRLQKIGEFAFFGCSSLTEFAFPDGVNNLSYLTFGECTGLTHVTIPRSVTLMGANVFNSCSNLTNIDVETENPCFTSKTGVLFNKSGTTLVSFPCGRAGRYDIPSGVQTVDQFAFKGANKLTLITVPESVSHLGYRAFHGCSSICGFYFERKPSIIGQDVFAGCNFGAVYYSSGKDEWDKSLGSLPTAPWDSTAPFICTTNRGTLTLTKYQSLDGVAVIPERINGLPLVSVGPSAFQRCTHITRVFIPPTVTQLGAQAFRDCISLRQVTVPDSVESIGREAFAGCAALSDVTLPVGLQVISHSMFSGCVSLTNVALAGCVIRVENDAFASCVKLPHLQFPASLVDIGNGAFKSCSSLRGLVFPGSITSVNSSAFASCNSMTALVVQAGSNVRYCSVDGVLFSRDGTTLIRFPAGKGGAYIVPNGVANIGALAFENCNELTDVRFAQTVTDIGESAFKSCCYLTNVSFSARLKSIGASAFRDCSRLAGLDLSDGLVTMGDAAFLNCPKIMRVSLPASLTSLGVNAFAFCPGVTSILVHAANATYCALPEGAVLNRARNQFVCYPSGRFGDYMVPDGINVISHCAFMGCSNLTSLKMPPSVAYVGNYAFQHCDSLTNLVLSSNTTGLGPETCLGCANLFEVTFPARVSSLGTRAFGNCPKLTRLFFLGNAPQLGNNVFMNSTGATVLYLPNTQGWLDTFGGLPTVMFKGVE